MRCLFKAIEGLLKATNMLKIYRINETMILHNNYLFLSVQCIKALKTSNYNTGQSKNTKNVSTTHIILGLITRLNISTKSTNMLKTPCHQPCLITIYNLICLLFNLINPFHANDTLTSMSWYKVLCFVGYKCIKFYLHSLLPFL